MFLDREIGFRDFTHHSDIWERLLTLTTFPPFHEMNFHKCRKLFQPQMPTIKVFIWRYPGIKRFMISMIEYGAFAKQIYWLPFISP